MPDDNHGEVLDALLSRVAGLEHAASVLESALSRVLSHLDPSGTSRTLFPVDEHGEPDSADHQH